MDDRLLMEILLVILAAAGFVGGFYGYRNGFWDGVKWAVEGEGYPSKPGPRWWAWRQLRAIVADDPRLRWARWFPEGYRAGLEEMRELLRKAQATLHHNCRGETNPLVCYGCVISQDIDAALGHSGNEVNDGE